MFKRLLSMFRKPNIQSIVVNDIDENQRLLLTSQAHAAYYSKMVEYYRDNVERLMDFRPQSYTNTQ